MNARLDDQFEDHSLLNMWAARIRSKFFKPANLVWSVGGIAAVGFVFSNALFFQQGHHPAAMFETREIVANNNLRSDEVSLESAVSSEDGAKLVTRIVLDANSNREFQTALPEKAVEQIAAKVEPVVAPSEIESTEVADLTELQQLLTELGYYSGTIDGITGPKTRAAIDAYKANVGLRGIELNAAELATSARNNLIVTAAIPTKRPNVPQEIPTRTVETVKYTPPAPTGSVSQEKPVVDEKIVKVQAGLRAFGNDTVVVDGNLGPQTVNAIKEFQILFKLPSTGTIDAALVNKMVDVGLIN